MHSDDSSTIGLLSNCRLTVSQSNEANQPSILLTGGLIIVKINIITVLHYLQRITMLTVGFFKNTALQL